MAPKKKETSLPSPSDSMFSGMFVFLVDTGVQPRRLQVHFYIHSLQKNWCFFFCYAELVNYTMLSFECFWWVQIWKQKLEQMGAKIEGYLSKKVTHIFAMNLNALKQKIDSKRLSTFKGVCSFFLFLID